MRPMMPSASMPTTSNCWTTAFMRNRFGCLITFQPAISKAPKKPTRPSIVRNAIDAESPILPSTRYKGGVRSGRTLTGWSALETRSSKDACSSLMPITSASRSRASLWTSHAPTVSIRVTPERSTAILSPSSASSREGRSPIRAKVRGPLNRRMRFPPSSTSVNSADSFIGRDTAAIRLARQARSRARQSRQTCACRTG